MMNPNAPHAVYRHIGADGAVLYVGCSHDQIFRHSQHLGTSLWARSVVRIDIQWLPNRVLALNAEAAAIASGEGVYNARGRRLKKKAPNNGHLFVADWLSFSEVSQEAASELFEVSPLEMLRLTTSVVHVRTAKARRIAIATSGYVPTWAWENHAWHGPQTFARLTSAEAEKHLALVQQ